MTPSSSAALTAGGETISANATSAAEQSERAIKRLLLN
jgi:hypothetical protein